MKKIHSESLLNIPLVRQALSDQNFKLQARAVDANWNYRKVIPISVSGFNPMLSTFYYPQKSLIAEWLKRPEISARELNESDALVKEVLFLAHDYLHSWAYRCVHALLEKKEFGSQPITAGNFEDYVFIHLLTEAVATVGLDYWYLSNIDLNQVCDIGTNLKALTVSYREENLKEYRRFNPDLKIQSPAFFEQLTEFYCDGVFSGFSLGDLKRSPMLLKWLEHELSYGEIQREYARSWFSFLSSSKKVLSQKALRAPVDVSVIWRKRLIRDVGQLLWDKVKNGLDPISFPTFDSSSVWKAAKTKAPDFRFLNLNQHELLDKKSVAVLPKSHFEFFFYQWVSRYDYQNFDKKLLEHFPELIQKKDVDAVKRLFKNQKLLKKMPGEPEHLFILN